MAKEPRKTTAFGASPESFNESRRSRSGNNDVENEEIISNDVYSSAHNSTHKDVHSSTHNHARNSAQLSKKTGFQEPKAKERKKKRVHLLTYESLIDRMDKYAARKGVKRVDVFEAAIIAFLDHVEENE